MKGEMESRDGRKGGRPTYQPMVRLRSLMARSWADMSVSVREVSLKGTWCGSALRASMGSVVFMTLAARCKDVNVRGGAIAGVSTRRLGIATRSFASVA
jgi:hypothetical protein